MEGGEDFLRSLFSLDCLSLSHRVLKGRLYTPKNNRSITRNGSVNCLNKRIFVVPMIEPFWKVLPGNLSKETKRIC